MTCSATPRAHYPLAMSRRSETVAAEMCVALGATDARVESYPSRELSLGSLAISRALPVKDSAWSGRGASSIASGR